MKQTRFFLLFILLIALVTCGNTVNKVQGSNSIAVARSTNTTLSVTDIAPIPNHFPVDVRNNFNRYTQVIPPNGKPINLFAQSNLTTAQIIHARNTLVFFLTDVPGSQYGANKTAVANQMGNNEAALMLLNGKHENDDFPIDWAQSLFEEELVVPGSDWYIDNDFEHRDATFEEIFHLVHDAGIGVDGWNSQPGVLPAYQQNIRAATNNAMANNFQIWPIDVPYDAGSRVWYDELSAENSLTQEYIAAVIDSYYGLWGPYDEGDVGMWGSYIAKTRADVAAKDPMGLALMQQFLSPYLTYNTQLDPNFNGTFKMSFDASKPYTHKSQYLLHATLTGWNNANLSGNDQNNELGGNSANNVLNGMGGFDTAVYPRSRSAYTITENDDGTVIVVGDGTDRLVNIEAIRFADNTTMLGDLGANTIYVPIVITEPAAPQPIRAFGDPNSTHIGHTVLRRPVREAPDNIYTDSGIYYSNEFAPYTKVMEVYGLTFIALPDAPDDFMRQVAKTLKEMFAQTPETDRARQAAVLKEMYRYRAILPIVSEPQSNRLDDVGGAEEVASVADIIMYGVAFQANEVVEHLLHAITSVGMHYALNPEFGLYEQSRLTQAMLEATSLGYYDYPTATFGSEGDSKVLVQEYVYWVIVTGWNIQERYKNGGDEWTIRNAAQLQAQQPSAYNLFENHIPLIMTVPSEATLQWFE